MTGQADRYDGPCPMGHAFDMAFPTALAIGMSPAQYWEGDCWLFAAYREARRLDNERAEWARWETGAYTLDALLKASPAFNPFSKKRKTDPWHDEPYGVYARRTPAQQAVHEEKKAHEKMIAWVLNHRPR